MDFFSHSAFYRRKANEAGLSLNVYLTKLLVEGAVAEKVHEFAETMVQKIAALAAVGKTGGAGVPGQLPRPEGRSLKGEIQTSSY